MDFEAIGMEKPQFGFESFALYDFVTVKALLLDRPFTILTIRLSFLCKELGRQDDQCIAISTFETLLMPSPINSTIH